MNLDVSTEDWKKPNIVDTKKYTLQYTEDNGREMKLKAYEFIASICAGKNINIYVAENSKTCPHVSTPTSDQKSIASPDWNNYSLWSRDQLA